MFIEAASATHVPMTHTCTLVCRPIIVSCLGVPGAPAEWVTSLIQKLRTYRMEANKFVFIALAVVLFVISKVNGGEKRFLSVATISSNT